MRTLHTLASRWPRRALAASIAALFAAQAARADLNWDTIWNNGAIDGGAWNYWNTSYFNWTATGGSNTTWDNTGAIFGGTGGFVTIQLPASVYGNAVEFQSDGRINAQRASAGQVGNKVSFGGLTVTGNRTMQMFSEGGRYTVGFGNGGATSTLAGNATIQTFEADGLFSTANVMFDGPIVESGGARSLTIVSNISADTTYAGVLTGTVTLNGAASHTGATDLRGGELALAGTNGKLTATSGLTVRNNTLFTYNNANTPGTFGAGLINTAAASTFTIDNSLTNVADRLADSIPITLVKFDPLTEIPGGCGDYGQRDGR